MIPTGLTKVIKNRWRVPGRLLTSFLFAVQDSQRVALHAPLAVRAQAFCPFTQVRQKGLSVARPALDAAQRIELQAHPVEPDDKEKIVEEQKNLCVHERVLTPQDLRPDLVELAQPTLLRSLAP